MMALDAKTRRGSGRGTPERRRSIRRGLELGIRVFGTDFQGRDFIEDATTLVVSQHGAKIRLKRQLIPEQEIMIQCEGNAREAPFRVVGMAGESSDEFSFWGVECLEPARNIWEGARPKPAPQPTPKPGVPPAPRVASPLAAKPSPIEELPTQIMMRCPQCGMRELVDLDEKRIRAIRTSKGLLRDCQACGASDFWKRIATQRLS